MFTYKVNERPYDVGLFAMISVKRVARNQFDLSMYLGKMRFNSEKMVPVDSLRQLKLS